MQHPSLRRFLPPAALALFVGELLLMLVSWLWSAAFPMSGVRSLLSGEGLRWLLGRFADVLASPLLVWLLLLAMAYGCLHESRLLHYHGSYRESRARLLALLLLLAYVAVVVLLAAVPHAVLLSATGRLWPSPFSASLVPLLAFVVTSISAFYGLVAGHFQGLRAVYDALLYGICRGAPWLLFYVLLMQLYESLWFVLP